jgi:hypothetical protein
LDVEERLDLVKGDGRFENRLDCELEGVSKGFD